MRSLRRAAVKAATRARETIRVFGFVAVSAGLLLVLSAGPAWALDESKKPYGANHERAHELPHKATGLDIRIGILEAPEDGKDGAVQSAHNLVTGAITRLLAEWKFTGIGEPTDISSSPGTDHATLVSDIAAGDHSTHVGVAKASHVYTASVGAYDRVRGAVDWMYRAKTDPADPWKDHDPIALFNMSFGGSVGYLNDTQAHINSWKTLNAAGHTENLTGAPFDFGGKTIPSHIHDLTIKLIIQDGDSDPGEFDYDNLKMLLDGVDVGVKLNTYKDGFICSRTFNVGLTQAQSNALIAALSDNKLQAKIQRIADLPDTDPGDGNTLKPMDHNFGSGLVEAELTLRKRNDNGTSQYTKFLDWHMNKFDTLVIKSAGNTGESSAQITKPGDFFNGITVGATDWGMSRRAMLSAYHLDGDDGSAPDVRGKPDILAPGTAIGDTKAYGGDQKGGTSFAAPHVTGVAAMLMEKGLNLGNPLNHNHLAIKAIIMNSARKRFINGPENSYDSARDATATCDEASDENYLDGIILRVGGTPGTKPPPHPTSQWTPTEWEYDGSLFTTIKPLDDEQGTGLLDAERALIQMDGGKQGPGEVGPVGWHRWSVQPGITYKYYLNIPIKEGNFITTTLCWDRIVNEINGAGGTVGQVDLTDTYDVLELADLDLNLYYKDTLIGESIAWDENVEHLHIPVSSDGAPLDYWIEVEHFGGGFTDYGVAWWTVPEPATLSLLVLGGLAMLRRRRRKA